MRDLGIDIVRIGSVQLHSLGSIFVQDNGRVFKYVKAGAAIALGDALVNDVAEGSFDVHPSSAVDQVLCGAWPNEGDGVGRARVAITDNFFFWMQVSGDALVKAAATVVAGAPAGTTATAGTLDDVAAAVGNALAAGSGVGAIFLTATTAGFARVQLS